MGRRVAVPTWADNIEEGVAYTATLFEAHPPLRLVRNGRRATDTPEAAARRVADLEALTAQAVS